MTLALLRFQQFCQICWHRIPKGYHRTMTDRYDYEQSPWAMPQQSHSCARAYFFQESHSARLEKQIFSLIKIFEF